MHRISGGDQKSVGSVLFGVMPWYGARLSCACRGETPWAGWTARCSAVLCRMFGPCFCLSSSRIVS